MLAGQGTTRAGMQHSSGVTDGILVERARIPTLLPAVPGPPGP